MDNATEGLSLRRGLELTWNLARRRGVLHVMGRNNVMRLLLAKSGGMEDWRPAVVLRARTKSDLPRSMESPGRMSLAGALVDAEQYRPAEFSTAIVCRYCNEPSTSGPYCPKCGAI